MKQRWMVAFLSMACIAMEVVWTRILGAEFFYTFAFLIISLAILGLGLGGLSLRLFPKFSQRIGNGWLLGGAALLALAAPVAVLHFGLDFSRVATDPKVIGLLAAAVLLLASPFLLAGAVLARTFRDNNASMPQLYMADLLGAGAGIAGAIVTMNLAGTPAAASLVALPLIGAALMEHGWSRALAFCAFLAVGVMILTNGSLLHAPRKERAPILMQHWDAMAKVKVYDDAPEYRGINIDNAANTPVHRFDGNWDKPDSLRFQFGIDISYLIRRMPSCTFLSLGAGGGGDVLQALQEGATEIHAVEVNPLINRMMIEGDLAEFSGHIYSDPRVRVVTEDARAYVRRFQKKFDVIFSLSSNTFAALASGSFALAENYLFTTEAFSDYYRALSDRGVLVMEHQFYVPRLVTEALQALRNEGIDHPSSHIAVYDLPTMRRNVLLLSRAPLDSTTVQYALGPMNAENYRSLHLLYPAPDSIANNVVNRVVSAGWQDAQTSTPTDLSPCSDDRPFTAQMGLWKNLSPQKLENLRPYEFQGFPLARLIIVVILGVILLLVLPLNLLPYFLKRKRLPPAAWTYFFLIGIAFMGVEVVLIQQYTLLIGPSSATIVTILLALLVGAGMGSRLAVSISDRVAFAGIIICLLLDVFLFPALLHSIGLLSMPWRICTAVIALLPLGFFMGMPFPKAALRAGELVDWGFAVNGAASAIGAAGVLLVSFAWGFQAALLGGAVLYLVAFAILRRTSAW